MKARASVHKPLPYHERHVQTARRRRLLRQVVVIAVKRCGRRATRTGSDRLECDAAHGHARPKVRMAARRARHRHAQPVRGNRGRAAKPIDESSRDVVAIAADWNGAMAIIRRPMVALVVILCAVATG